MTAVAAPQPLDRPTIPLRGVAGGAMPAGDSIRLAGEHFAAALLYLLTGTIGLVWIAPQLAAGADTRWTRRSLAFLAGGVLALAAGLLTGSVAAAWLGVVLLEGGVACFLWQAFAFYRARVRPKIDIGMRFAACALGFLAASAVLGPAVLAAGIAHPRLATAYVTIGLLGAIVLYVIGFFYKIVPLLAWTARFRGRMGNGSVPTVAALYSTRVAHAQLGLMVPGIVLLGAGIGAGSVQVTRGAALLVLGGVLLFASQIARVAVGGRS